MLTYQVREVGMAKRYTEAQKQKALALLDTHTMAAVAQKTGVSVNALGDWKKAAGLTRKPSSNGSRPKKAENPELVELRRENKVLREALAILARG